MPKPENKPDKPGKPDKPPVEPPPVEPPVVPPEEIIPPPEEIIEPPPEEIIPPPTGLAGWSTLKLGAGGQLTNIDRQPDGTMVVRADTYGGYVWDAEAANPGNAGGQGCWRQLVTDSSLPGNLTINRNASGGCWEVCIAPSNTSVFYMYYGGDGLIYRSSDKGAHWTKCGPLPGGPFYVVPNGESKFVANKMAVDPLQADHVFTGTPANGAFVSKDGGTNWTAVPTVAASTSPVNPDEWGGQNGGNIFAYDPRNNGVLFAATWGVGVYKSSDNGSSFSLINSTGMPTWPQHMLVDTNGVLWVASGGNLYKLAGTTWTHVGAGIIDGMVSCLAVKPGDPNKILVNASQNWFYSTDGGITWGNRLSGAPTKTATDIPWLTHDIQITCGNTLWASDDVIYMAEGTGVWHFTEADIPMEGWNRPHFTSLSVGIEQLVVNWIISPPGGNVVVNAMDRACWVLNDQSKYPTDHGISYANSITEGYSCDWASSDSSFLVTLTSWNFNPYGKVEIGKATGGGGNGADVCWTIVNNPPVGPAGFLSAGGCIAAATPSNWVYVEANGAAADGNGNHYGGSLHHTRDGGNSWQPCVVNGLPFDSCWYNQNSNYSLRRQIVIADRVRIGTFYLYNSGTVAPGIYRSTDGGATFVRVCPTRLDGGAGQDNWNCQWRALPPYAGYAGGEMYATGGIQDPGNSGSALHECKDIGGSVTMTAVPGTSFVWSVGIGAPKPGGSGYPTIFIYGSIDAAHDAAGIGGRGVWQSDDHCTSWHRLSGEVVAGWMDQVNVVEGDANMYGKCYVGFTGSGAVTYMPASD